MGGGRETETDGQTDMERSGGRERRGGGGGGGVGEGSIAPSDGEH